MYAGRNPETGAIRHVSRGTTKGIKAARTLRSKLVTEVDEGRHGATAGTFGQLLDQWLEDGKQGRAETTLAGYRTNIESTIRPALGSKMLDKLTTTDIDKFYGDLIRSGTSAAMVKHHARTISAALRQAERWGLVPVNVAHNAQPPRAPVHDLTIPPPDRVRRLIDAAAASRIPEMATIITVAALTGIRRGELCGLRWSDIDWQGSSLTVNRSIWQTSDGRIGSKDPKTHQVRHLVLGPVATGALAGRRERVDNAVALAEVDLADDAYVFSDGIDGSDPIRPNTLSRRFKNLCDAMAVADVAGAEPWKYRLHDLRHYTATELVAAGHSIRTVADRLGHADPALTARVYVHDTDAQAIAAAASLEAGLAG